MKKVIMLMVGAMLLANVAVAAGDPGVVVGGGSSLTAELPASLPMIKSSFELLSWAKSRVKNAYSYGGSYGPVIPGGRTSVQVGKDDSDIRSISTFLSESMLDFRVALPEEVCYFGASMADCNGHELFYGNNYFYLSQDGEEWSVPQGATEVTLQLVDNVPIPVPGVQWANMYIKDDNGNTTYRSINTWGGYIFFPKSLANMTNAGWTAVLTLYNGNGGKAYNMTTGEVIPGTQVKAGVKTNIERLVTLDDPTVVKDIPKSVSGQGRRNWYQIKITSATTVDFYGITTEGEVASRVSMRPATEAGETQSFDIVPGSWVPLELSPGVYDVWFEYPEFDREEPAVPPYYYGSMG